MNMMIFSCVLLACMPLVTVAADEGSERVLIGSGGESQTAYWLRLQREGQLASPHPQTSTPAERELTMQRWLESHKQPIPEFFDQDVSGELGD